MRTHMQSPQILVRGGGRIALAGAGCAPFVATSLHCPQFVNEMKCWSVVMLATKSSIRRRIFAARARQLASYFRSLLNKRMCHSQQIAYWNKPLIKEDVNNKQRWNYLPERIIITNFAQLFSRWWTLMSRQFKQKKKRETQHRLNYGVHWGPSCF